VKTFVICGFLLLSAGLFAQAVPEPTPMPKKIYSRDPITIIDPARENPIMVLYENKRVFVKTAKSVTDSISAKNRYRILTNNDSIARYTNSKFVRQVVLIEPR
jgi:hypothetical protein